MHGSPQIHPSAGDESLSSQPAEGYSDAHLAPPTSSDVLPRGRGNIALQTGAIRRLFQVTFRHLSIRRAFAFFLYTLLWGSVRSVMKITSLLDDIFFPAWRRTRVTKPVFIFANPRSGTTMLHRLLSLDHERWATVKLYQTLFASVVWHKLFAACRWVDERVFFGLLRKVTVDLGNWLFFKSRWEDIHEMGFDKAEEDEATFVFSMHTPTTMLLSPFPDELRDLAWMDALPYAEKQAAMDHYEGSLRRLLHSHGEGRRFLNKNVFFSPRIKTMHARFPDATFVYLVRHPYDGLGSFLSMFYAAWKTHSPDIDKNSPEAKQLARFGMDYLRYALELQRELPPERFVVIRYDELVQNPKRVVSDLYQHLGEEMSGSFDALLTDATSLQREHRSKHEYSLEEYGLTEDEVYEELKDVFEAYGFER